MIEVLKQMVEALEHELCIDWTNNEEFNASAEKMHDAIQAGKQAISELEQRSIAELESQEPVAKLKTSNVLLRCHSCGYSDKLTMQIEYTHPPQRTAQEPVAFDVTLDEAAVEMLNAFTSPLPPSLDEYNELRLMLGEGHSGYGLYLSMAEYPEEGAELLVNTRPLQRKPLTDKVLNIIASQWHMNLLVGKEKADVMSFARAIEAAHGIKE